MVKFVIVKMFKGVEHYLKSETIGTLAGDGRRVERQSLGFFSPNPEDAIEYSLKQLAEYVASGYDGAKVKERVVVE